METLGVGDVEGEGRLGKTRRRQSESSTSTEMSAGVYDGDAVGGDGEGVDGDVQGWRRVVLEVEEARDAGWRRKSADCIVKENEDFKFGIRVLLVEMREGRERLGVVGV